MSDPVTRADPHRFPHRTVALRRPPSRLIDDESTIDLGRAAALVNSGVLTAEISAAIGDPDLEA